MEGQVCVTFIQKSQNHLYTKLNNFAVSNKIAGRLCSIPVSILDVALDLSATTLAAIECIAVAAINLFGAVYRKDCTLRKALIYTEFALMLFSAIPSQLLIGPIKIAFQFFTIIINPTTAESINFTKASL